MALKFIAKKDCTIQIPNSNLNFEFKKEDLVELWWINSTEKLRAVPEDDCRVFKNGKEFYLLCRYVELRQELEKSEDFECLGGMQCIPPP